MNLTDILETTEVQLATNPEQIQGCYKIMHQLRPHLTSEQAFVEHVQRQIHEGYHLAYFKIMER